MEGDFSIKHNKLRFQELFKNKTPMGTEYHRGCFLSIFSLHRDTHG